MTPLVVHIVPLDLVRGSRNAPQETLGEAELIDPSVIQVLPLPIQRPRESIGAGQYRYGHVAQRRPDRQAQGLRNVREFAKVRGVGKDGRGRGR